MRFRESQSDFLCIRDGMTDRDETRFVDDDFMSRARENRFHLNHRHHYSMTGTVFDRKTGVGVL
jgi:hypothetical protein